MTPNVPELYWSGFLNSKSLHLIVISSIAIRLTLIPLWSDRYFGDEHGPFDNNANVSSPIQSHSFNYSIRLPQKCTHTKTSNTFISYFIRLVTLSSSSNLILLKDVVINSFTAHVRVLLCSTYDHVYLITFFTESFEKNGCYTADNKLSFGCIYIQFGSIVQGGVHLLLDQW